MTFEANNINCANCANTIKNALKDEFGEISVDLSTTPRRVSVEIDESRIDAFKEAMDELGFSVIREVKQ